MCNDFKWNSKTKEIVELTSIPVVHRAHKMDYKRRPCIVNVNYETSNKKIVKKKQKQNYMKKFRVCLCASLSLRRWNSRIGFVHLAISAIHTYRSNIIFTQCSITWVHYNNKFNFTICYISIAAFLASPQMMKKEKIKRNETKQNQRSVSIYLSCYHKICIEFNEI